MLPYDGLMRPGDEHYFSSTTEAQSDPKKVDVLLPDVDLTLWSDAGVFSHGRLDGATRIFLETAPPPPQTGALLDLGCGYGAIALTLAARSPAAQVIAVDVNERALDLVRQNAEEHGFSNVTAYRPAEVPADLRFAAIYSNPPVRIGKRAMREMLQQWLGRLDPDGVAYIVVGKHLGSDSLAQWLDAEGYDVQRIASRNSYRTLEVKHRRDAS